MLSRKWSPNMTLSKGDIDGKSLEKQGCTVVQRQNGRKNASFPQMKCREDRTEARMLKKTPKRYIQRDIPRVPLPHNTIPVPIFHHKAVLRTAFLLGQLLKTCSFVREYVVAMCRQCKGGGMCRPGNVSFECVVNHRVSPTSTIPGKVLYPMVMGFLSGGYLNFFLPHQTHTHIHTYFPVQPAKTFPAPNFSSRRNARWTGSANIVLVISALNVSSQPLNIVPWCNLLASFRQLPLASST